MNYFSRLFNKAPFDYLQLHMEKVTLCLEQLEYIFKSLDKLKSDEIEKLSKKVSDYEHEADLIKNDIRRSLPKNFLFVIDRNTFLEILSLQDNLADCAEDIAKLLTLRPIVFLNNLKREFQLYVNKVFETSWDTKNIILTLDELIEASFGGVSAEKVNVKIEETAFKEHEVDIIKHKLIKEIFLNHSDLEMADFYLSIKLIEEIGLLAHFAEKLALKIGMLLDIK